MDEQVFYNEDTGMMVVDVQADFTELISGTLAVPGTVVQYIDSVEKTTRQFLDQGLHVYFTQDWHPADHVSFFTNNPVECWNTGKMGTLHSITLIIRPFMG